MNNLTPKIILGIITASLAIIQSITGWAQDRHSVYNVEDKKVYSHARYDEIKGSPYLYEKWLPADILGSDGKFHKYPKVNFNGLTNEIESDNDGNIIQFARSYFITVTFDTESGKETFLGGAHPEFGKKLVCLLFEGHKVKLYKHFDVEVEESVAQTPGIPTVFESFERTSTYYLLINGNLKKVRLKKKKIIEALGHKPEIEGYVKKEKIDLGSEDGFKTLLSYYETLN
jgi:hypothetical protein